eukprot:TRINITY_DN9194_c0_g1_i1.p1 TRINITY_DN9194_c0_g1~~TRINITY_DN9194_c0_g1_i1.p1  ORF type:complete len:106 (+),score=3.24 TRINITY_DN9194_c0_g1_i1:132-449(+)
MNRTGQDFRRSSEGSYFWGRSDANLTNSNLLKKEGKRRGEGEHQDCSEIDAGIGAEKIPCPKKDVLSLIPMAHQLSLNADTGGTSTLPKLSLAIKEELMQKKGLF